MAAMILPSPTILTPDSLSASLFYDLPLASDIHRYTAHTVLTIPCAILQQIHLTRSTALSAAWKLISTPPSKRSRDWQEMMQTLDDSVNAIEIFHLSLLESWAIIDREIRELRKLAWQGDLLLRTDHGMWGLDACLLALGECARKMEALWRSVEEAYGKHNDMIGEVYARMEEFWDSLMDEDKYELDMRRKEQKNRRQIDKYTKEEGKALLYGTGGEDWNSDGTMSN